MSQNKSGSKRYIVFDCPQENATSMALLLNCDNGDAIRLHDPAQVFAIEIKSGDLVTQDWTGTIAPNQVLFRQGTRLLRGMLGSLSGIYFEAVVNPDGTFSLGERVTDPSSI